MSDLLLPDRIGRLLPPDTLQRVQGLLVVAYSVTELQTEDEAELADSIARIIDDAVSYRRVPAPYGDLLEVADRAVLRILARQALRYFRKKWGRLSEEQRQRLRDGVLQATKEL